MIDALTITSLAHRYASKTIFENVNLSLKNGEWITILGPSGAGKTTLLRAIAGFIEPSYGKIELQNKLVFENGKNNLPIQERRIGFMPQDYALFPHQTVSENIAFGLQGKLSKTESMRVSQQLGESLGLAEFMGSMPMQLSGGQQQRVALARALAIKPQLLLLDEPLANIDPIRRSLVADELYRIVKSTGVSVLMVTHDRTEAFNLSDKIAILDDCKTGLGIVQCDTAEVVYAKPANACVARLTGETCLLPAEGFGDYAESYLGRVSLIHPFHGQGFLVLRPEQLKYTAEASGNGRISTAYFEGARFRVSVETPFGTMTIYQATKDCHEKGALGKLSVLTPVWMVKD